MVKVNKEENLVGTWYSGREDGVNSWLVFGHPTYMTGTQSSLLNRGEMGPPVKSRGVAFA